MLRSSLRLYQAVLPISKTEFLDAISRVCPTALQDGGQRIGLAISGGVDSMALAVMCRKYLPHNGTSLKAFIVDHKLRPSSTDEAHRTRDYLKSHLDINAEVLTLSPPAKLRAVETWAREARYSALNTASQSQNLDNIMTAHHEDDQYETILLRLCQASRHNLGMASNTTLPFEVEKDDVPESAFVPWPLKLRPCFGVTGLLKNKMKLIRPLLIFEKTRLEATCSHHEITWTDDETNADRSLTLRNTLRHTLARFRLPKALRKSNILEMFDRQQHVDTGKYDIVDQLLGLTITHLDPRVGAMYVKFPSAEMLSSISTQLEHKSAHLTPEMAEHVLLLLLNKAMDMVKAGRRRSSPNGGEMLSRIFAVDGIEASSHRKAFATRGVLCKPHEDGGWYIWRTAQLTGRNPNDSTGNPNPDKVIRLPPSTIAGFQRWNFNFFIRVSNPASEDLYMRPLAKHHLNTLQKLLYDGDVYLRDVNDPAATPRSLEAIIGTFFAKELYRSLPVIVSRPAHLTANHGICQAENETILAFPTLNLRVEGRKSGVVPDWIQYLLWDIRYKSLELGNHRLEDVLVNMDSKASQGLEE